MTQTDLIIIGAGPGGYRAAEYAAKKGLKVVIFEAGNVGGTCLNEGCIPTKCYARNAEVVSLMNDGNTYGISHNGFDFLLELARSRKDTVIQQLRTGIETLLAHPNITLVHAEARFVDDHTVAIVSAPVPPVVPVSLDSTSVPPVGSVSPYNTSVSLCCDTVAAKETYTAPHIIVATGSVPKSLPIDGVALTLDSRDLLQLDRLPESLCIIGAGVIGMEFASIFNAFGTKVTVVEFLKECLPALDSDIAKRLRKVMEKRGVDFRLQCAVTGVQELGNSGVQESGSSEVRKVVTFKDKKDRELSVEADEVLMAVGRAPRVFDHFKNAGFDYDSRTGIHVDNHCETTVPGIFAIGDVNGRQMLAHAAEAQAKMVVDYIVSTGTVGESIPVVPAAIFTNPEAACVGKTEDQLKAEGTPYECRKAFHRANGKALAMNETEGMVKLLSEPDAGRILGCYAFGAHSADLIQEACVLMCRDTTVDQLRTMVHIHPTLGELLLSAAETEP